MFSARELRPGNWLIDKVDNNLCIVRSIAPTLSVERFNNVFYHCTVSQLKEIPITEDLIFLCGFKPEVNEYIKKMGSGNYLYLTFVSPNEVSIWNNDIIGDQVEYIHQLQNAYFFLTGEELNPNLFGAKIIL